MEHFTEEKDRSWLTQSGLKRRTFLSLCTAGALLAACSQDPAITAAASPKATIAPKPTSTPTQIARLTDNDWAQLGKKLKGTLIRPDSPQYDTAHQLFDEKYDAIKPAGIAYCASVQDIQTCLSFVKRFNVLFTARAGGHSYAGYSTTPGLIIDVTKMNTVTVDTQAQTATIGAGTRLIDVYAQLAQSGVVIPAGSCPTVGIAGLTMGGGIGVIGRKFGLTCDSLLSAQIVTADGRSLTCDAQHNADLFWGLQGGGGGNFGIVTSFTFQTHTVNNLVLFTLDWPWSSAADVVNAWQHWAPQAPDELWSNCLLLTTADKNADPIIRVNGVYVGDETGLDPLLNQLSGQINAAPSSRYVTNDGLLGTMQYEAGCYGQSVAACHLPGQTASGQLQRNIMEARSDYYTQLLPGNAITDLVNAIESRHADANLGEGGIGMDASGGAINRVAADATAFVHRNALFSIQYTANRNPDDSAAIIAENQNWLNGVWQDMRSYASGFAYQNYIDPNLQNWQQAYYGGNLARLRQIKAKYDPHNLFHFAQSIAPAR